MSVLVFVFALCCAVLCCASASALVCTCPCFVCVLCQSAFLFQQETERERRVLDRLFEEQTETLGRLKGDYDSACQAVGESCTSVSRECLARLLLLQCRGYTGVQGQLLRPNT
eukprot:m.228269 g.228269  ORF g.228269 m.228269 type:complete len:113 (+) comp18827_c0_seq8:3384-3722(+)